MTENGVTGGHMERENMARDIFGTNFSETINGTSGADNIYGYDGDDDIFGRGGDDLIDGGRGDDFLYGGSGNDILIGGTGFNDLWGDSGYDLFTVSVRDTSGFSDDLVRDFTFDVDQIDLTAWGVSDFSQVEALLYADSYGDAAINAYYAGLDHVLTLDYTAPGDLIASDFVYADPAALVKTGTGLDDVLFGSRFNDTLRGGVGADSVLGGLGNDTLTGDTGDDLLVGGAGVDRLTGGAGNDWLEGDDGADTITGSAGRDTMEGGAGADRFTFDDPDFGGKTATTADLILDFSHAEGDKINLAAVDAKTGGTDDAFSFIGTAAFSGVAGQLHYQFSGGDTLVSGDLNGDRAADFMIVLDGQQALVSTDFIL